jgi:hypothetical protein
MVPFAVDEDAGDKVRDNRGGKGGGSDGGGGGLGSTCIR